MGTISSRFLIKNIDSLANLNVDRSALIDRVPDGEATLNDPIHRFEGDVLIDIFDLAESLSKDPAIGFRCGLGHGNVLYSDIAYNILHCKNLRESFEVSARYEPIAQQYGENSLLCEGRNAHITWTTFEDAPERLRHISDLSFASLARMGFWMKAVHGLPITDMKVCHANDSYRELYEHMFSCPIEYGAKENVLTFDKKFLEIPLPGANAELLKLLTSQLDADLAMLNNPVTDIDKVSAYLRKTLGKQPPTLDSVSQLMGLPEWTLRRRLKAMGTSFRDILEAVRRERYKILSAQPDLSQVEIAGRLGYSDQSALSRAYKKWYGTPPARRKTSKKA